MKKRRERRSNLWRQRQASPIGWMLITQTTRFKRIGFVKSFNKATVWTDMDNMSGGRQKEGKEAIRKGSLDKSAQEKEKNGRS